MKRIIPSILVAIVFLTCCVSIEVSALTTNQTKVKNNVLNQVGNYYAPNYCQAFVANGYIDAGIGCSFAYHIHCANYAYQRFVVWESTDINEDIPIGACVYFKNGGVDCSCGKDAGHVGIYVGDGYFVHARASQEKVCKNRLSESWYKSRYIGWGWYNDFELADDGLTIEGRYYIANDPDGAHNVRASASSSANIVTKIPNGTKVLVTKYSSDNQWGYLTYNGISGWTVLSPYMEFDSVCYEVCEHNYSSASYESTHPHKEYKKCSLCGDIQYTGNTKLVSGCTSCYPPDGYLYKSLDNDTSNPSFPGKWLRSSDSTNGTIIGSVPYGEYAVVTKYNSDKTWAYVKYKGIEGWTKLYESTFPYQDTYYCPVVTFNANGGSVSTSSKKVYLNNPYGTLPTPTRIGYKFNGWYTAASGGTKITDTTNVNLTANQTLYAQWTANNYTVTFNANGGSNPPANQTKTHGVNLTLSSEKPTKTGYTFKGWSTSNDSTVEYAPGATYTANEDVTLYAVWTANTYTVSYNANGGSNPPSSQIKTHGVSLTLRTTAPTRSGYTFKGWSTSVNGSVAYAAGATYSANSAVTLYAIWERNNIDAESLVLGEHKTVFEVGETDTVSLSVVPSNADWETMYFLYYDSDVVKLDWINNENAFKVTAIAPGETEIIIELENTSGSTISTKYQVEVKSPVVSVTDITLNKTSATLNVGGTETLTATVAPSNATNKTVTWTSSNSSVASVSNGVVTAKAAGTATITVKTADGNKTATCTVTVKTPTVAVTGISLNKTATTLTVGATETLTATVAPTNATDKTVTWTSSNPSVASVSNGVITAKSAGTATITVKTADGNKTASCVVVVFAPEEPVNPDAPIITVSSVKTVSGKQVVLNLDLKNNPGIAGLTIEVEYDAALVLDKVDAGSALSNLSFMKPSNVHANPVKMIWFSTDNDSSNGKIATLTFTVPDNTPEGIYNISANVANNGASNSALEYIQFQTVDGSIMVIDAVIGDTTGDNSVDIRDVILLAQYCAEWDSALDTVNPASADTNGDGSVDIRDVILLAQYCAGYDVVLG